MVSSSSTATSLVLGNLAKLPSAKQASLDEIQTFVKFDKITNSLNLDLTGLPFWIWDPHEHTRQHMVKGDNCCFNHLVGLPVKEGNELPLFPYELEIWKALFEPLYANPNNDFKKWKHVFIKKAPGMGVTELMMRIILYLAFCHSSEFKGTQIVIMTGIRMNTAREIMDRMRALLYEKLKIFIDTNSSYLIINGCKIQSYPAKTPQAIHGIPNVSLIFIDEFDFFSPSLYNFVMNAVERYFGKSNPFVVLNSTVNIPNGLLERIEKQTDEECKYKRLFLLWKKGYGYMYTKRDIMLARQSDSWSKEYEGEYYALFGNLFSKEVLEFAARFYDILNIKDRQTFKTIRQIKRIEGELNISEVISDFRYLGSGYPTSIGIDIGYASSKFAYVATKYIDGIIYVVKEISLDYATHEESVEKAKNLLYDDYPSFHPKIFADASGVSFIRTLKQEIYDQGQDYHKLTPDQLVSSMKAANGMIVCPIAFGKYSDRMIYHMRRLFELGIIRLDPKLTPLLWQSLQTASYDKERQTFDKENTAYNDVFDAFRLALINIEISNQGVLYLEKDIKH